MLQLSDFRDAADELRRVRRTYRKAGVSFVEALKLWREALVEKMIDQRAQEREDARSIGANPDLY